MGTRRIKKRKHELQTHPFALPLPPEIPPEMKQQIEDLDSAMIEVLVKSGTPHELIFAYLKTNRMVTRENMQFLSDEDLEEWNEAIEEYRTDKRIQSALANSIESTLQAEKSSAWHHFMCMTCWQKLGFAQEDTAEQVHQRCCYCGQMSQSGFNLTGNPEETACHGKHEQ